MARSATLTKAQADLLDLLRSRDQPVEVRGARLRTARALEARGLARVTIGGTGLAYSGHWWYEAVASDPGTEVLR